HDLRHRDVHRRGELRPEPRVRGAWLEIAALGSGIGKSRSGHSNSCTAACSNTNLGTDMRFRIRQVRIVLALAAWAMLAPTARAENGIWTSGGPNGKSIKEIVAHPNNTNVLYAGAFGLGVFKSIDGGLTWRGHKSGFENSFVRCLTLDTARPETLYAGT